MMETAEPWHRQDLMAAALILPCGTTRRRFLCQREMRPVLVIIADVLVHQTFQMPLVQGNHMVEQITAAVADPTFGKTILPRTSKAGSLGLDAEALHGVDDFFIEVCTAIEDQIARSRVVGECFAHLLNNPRAGWVSGHLIVENSSSIIRNDEETV